MKNLRTVPAGAAWIMGYSRSGRPLPLVAGGDGRRKREEIEAELKVEVKAATDIASKKDEASAEEVAEGYKRLERIRELKAELKQHDDRDGLFKALTDVGGSVGLKNADEIEPSGPDGALTEADLRALEPVPSLGSQGKALSKAFLSSPAYRRFMKAHADGDGQLSNGTQVEIPRIRATKADPVPIGSGVTSAGALYTPDERGLLDFGTFRRRLVLRDLLTVGRTSSSSIRYARLTGFTNAATGVHEAGSATGTNAAGGLKPMSDVALVIATANVVTIAHLFTASKQSLADAPFMRTIIDQLGMYGLAEEEEDQIIAGTGSANDQLDGFNTVSNMQTQVFDTDIFRSIRKGLTKVEDVGKASPNGVLVNYADDEKMDLFRTDGGGGAGTGPWAGMGPWRTGPPQVWGLPRIVSAAVPSGKAYVADFRTIVFLVREDPSVAVTDSHADYFRRNLIAMLFEERATQLVLNPKAICEVATA